MLRVGEENARLNCRGEEDSRAKWSKVEATWRTVVLGPENFSRFIQGGFQPSSFDTRCADLRLFANEESP